MNNQFMHKGGVVLVTVIIFIIIICILAVSLLLLMTSQARQTERQIKRIQAGYAAQAGIQHYLDLLKTIPNPGTRNINEEGISVDIDMPPAPVPAECPGGDPNAACVRARATY